MDQETLATIGRVLAIVFVLPVLGLLWRRTKVAQREAYDSDVWALKWALRLRGHWRGSKEEAVRRVGRTRP